MRAAELQTKRREVEQLRAILEAAQAQNEGLRGEAARRQAALDELRAKTEQVWAGWAGGCARVGGGEEAPRRARVGGGALSSSHPPATPTTPSPHAHADTVQLDVQQLDGVHAASRAWANREVAAPVC